MHISDLLVDAWGRFIADFGQAAIEHGFTLDEAAEEWNEFFGNDGMADPLVDWAMEVAPEWAVPHE